MEKNTQTWAPDWLNHMYDNRSRIKESGEHITNWRQRSEAFREELTAENRAHLNIAYGTKKAETLDVFCPVSSDDKKVPVLVYIHGGWWSALDKDDHSFVATEWVKKGYCVVVVNYTLCPNETVPGIVQEAARAVAWVKNNIANYGGDSERITVSGHSAGGHLTGMMMTIDWQQFGFKSGSLPFRSGVSISGLFDLTPMQQAPFLAVLGLTDEQVAIASPAKFTPNNKGVFFAVVGGDETEEHIRQNKIAEDVWGKEIVSVCEAIKNEDHFTIVDSLSRPDSRLFELIQTLLAN